MQNQVNAEGEQRIIDHMKGIMGQVVFADIAVMKDAEPGKIRHEHGRRQSCQKAPGIKRSTIAVNCGQKHGEQGNFPSRLQHQKACFDIRTPQ